MKKTSNWNHYPIIDATITSFTKYENQPLDKIAPYIVRGLGRSYGDASLQTNIISNHQLNHFLQFDTQKGVFKCESGVSFSEILKVIVPKGWFLPVTPGTKFITVGGAIASDIHGKNHHQEGSFGDHVLSFTLQLPDGKVIDCNKHKHTELFFATLGGMGLTGIILDATIQLKSIETAFIQQDTIKARNLDEIMGLFDESDDWTYSVAWIDCLTSGQGQGRSILMRGKHATLNDISNHDKKRPLQGQPDKSKTIPFYFPNWALNPLSIRAFNSAYYHKQFRKKVRATIHYDPFFYPLDGIHHWNRMYGKRGFLQYQFVLPLETSRHGLKDILTAINKEKSGSFLAVLKKFGHNNNTQYLSFPMAGYTLALDFPITPSLFPFLDRLDKKVLEYGGRIYLSKDARLSASHFHQMYKISRFQSIKQRVDPQNRIKSKLSERLRII